MRDWLSRHLARALGITANVHFPFPNRFATMALGLVDPTRPSAVDDDPWAVERLTWAVLEVLARGDVAVPGSTRTAATDAVESAEAPDAVRSRQYVVARHVADLFDQYATNRPDVLRQWAAGVPGDGTVGADRDLVGALDESMRWQFELFQAVRARIGVPNPAEQFAVALDELRAGRREPALPPRVALFGLSTLSATQLDLLAALGAVCDVGVFLVDPSPAAWDRAAPQPPGRLVPRRRDVDVDDDMPDGHPLLRSWGRLSAETASLVRGHVDPIDVATRMAPVADAAPTLLGHVQRDLVLDRAPTPFGGGADGTVQVHACHGALRQLEALRDALDALFVGDPTLTPRDVVVMSPDISRFAPFAAAVFERGALPVPVTVSDLTLGAENPVATALRTIVATLAGRCTASDVLSLAALEPVRRTLGLTAADLERFAHWVDALGTRWGLDPGQRSEWVRGDIVEGTWAATLDRLLLGAAVAVAPATDAVAPSFPGDVLPYDDMAADDMRSAGRLAELLARLREARRLLGGRHVVDEWADRLARVLASLCSVAADSAWQLAAVAAAVDELRVRSTIGDTPSAVLLDVREVRAVLDDAIGGARGRLRTRSGDVLLTGLVPLRNVPARVVCLLGLDADSMRPAAVDGDDLLARRPCVGERDRRAERRHGLLDAVMAASDHLVVTYDGFDIATDRPVRAAVALVELLDVVTATLGEDAEHAGVVIHHPRRAYDARLFESTTVAPGFDGVMLAAAETRRAPGAGERTWASRFDAPLPLLVPEHVSLEKLATACTRPARVLLRDRLGLRVPGRAEDLDVNIPMSPSPLRVAELGRDLLERLIRHPANDRDTVVARWRADARHAGSLAPRRLGEEALAVVEAQVIEMVSALGAGDRTLDEASRAVTAIAVDVEIVVDEPDGGPAARRPTSCRRCSTAIRWPCVSSTRSTA